jgi:hypothetical protein
MYCPSQAITFFPQFYLPIYVPLVHIKQPQIASVSLIASQQNSISRDFVVSLVNTEWPLKLPAVI